MFLPFVDWELRFGVLSLGRGIWEPKLVTLIILSGIVIVAPKCLGYVHLLGSSFLLLFVQLGFVDWWLNFGVFS